MNSSQVSSQSSVHDRWWLCWEIYVLFIVATLLRLYGIQTTEFDDDQVMVFRIAYDALHQGALIATSNVASIHILNPPGFEYILMLPALLGSDPIWAAILTAVLSIAGVMLTYFFVRYYYGRLTAFFTGSFYAVAVLPVFYSRFIWQQNLLLFFVPLFIMVIFRGVVSRRHGWFAPALALFGLLVQMHGSSILLLPVLLVAWILAPGTVRWRDAILGVFLVLLLYAPYIWWEIASHFSDVFLLLHQLHQPGHLDALALLTYQQFLNTHLLPLYPGVYTRIAPFVSWTKNVLSVLLCLGFCLVISEVIGRYKRGETIRLSFSGRIRRWWSELRADPYRCGLLVLLVWQIAPLLLLLHHSIGIAPFYLLILLPGPFLFIGLFLERCAHWLQRNRHWRIPLQVGFSVLVALLVLAQLFSSTAMILDLTAGNFQDTQLSSPYYNDLRSLQNAFTLADQLAQRRHLRHIYVVSNEPSMKIYNYFAEHSQVPTTVFSGNCILIPGRQIGPAALLIAPYQVATGQALLQQFASTTLVSLPQRLGGTPFRLAIIQPAISQRTSPATFSHQVALQAAQSTTIDGSTWVVTRWSVLRAMLPAPRVVDTYSTTLSLQAHQTQSQSGRYEYDKAGLVIHQTCTSTSWQVGDQMVLASPVPAGVTVPPTLSVGMTASQAQPVLISLPLPGGGHLSAETAAYSYPSSILYTSLGQQRETVRVISSST